MTIISNLVLSGLLIPTLPFLSSPLMFLEFQDLLPPSCYDFVLDMRIAHDQPNAFIAIKSNRVEVFKISKVCKFVSLLLETSPIMHPSLWRSNLFCCKDTE